MFEPSTDSRHPQLGAVAGKRTVDRTAALPIAELPDLLLIERSRNRDARAFEALMRRYNRRLFRIARSILHDTSAAQDAVQEAWLRAFTHLDRYEATGKFGAWLARVTFNEALMIRRRARPTVPLQDESTLAQAAPPESPAYDTPLDAIQIREQLENAIDALPEVFRTVFVLRVVEQLSGVETAACLGLNETTVRTRLFRAHRRLRWDLAHRLRTEGAEVFGFQATQCDGIVAHVLGRMYSPAPDHPHAAQET